MFSIWKEDFGTSVPVQLIFSKKNMGYLAEAKQREVKLVLMCGAGWDLCRNSASPQCSLGLVWLRPAGFGQRVGLVSVWQWKRGMCTTCQGLVPALGGSQEGTVLVRNQWQNGPFGLGYCKGWTCDCHWLHPCVFYQLAFLHVCWCYKHSNKSWKSPYLIAG